MKILRWVNENILFVCTLFLLLFIPLYPKIPLVDVKNTWVYVRLEDFIVLLILSLWLLLIIRKKTTLRTPLTIPIFIFWIVGAIATIHGALLIFPYIAGVFPNVALLSFLRRIEYLSVFFIAYSGMKDKRFLSYVLIVLVTTLLLVVGYGIGQKYLGFPAYLTMNEEFAKGEGIRLSPLSRVPSTFAGHYDLAAYLVLVLPIIASMAIGLKNFMIRIALLICVISGVVLMFMTVSRVSFVVLFIAFFLVLVMQKKKKTIFFLLVISLLGLIFLMSFMPALMQRFGNTVKEVEVLVDAKTGEVIGHVTRVPKTYFENKTIIQRSFRRVDEVPTLAVLREEEVEQASPSLYYPYENVPLSAVLIVPPNAPTGENLPQGTGYINLSLSPVTKELGNFFYEDQTKKQATSSATAFAFSGSFLIKRAAAYDLSFTTRFQGEWPSAIKAFMRNIFLGSGYSSVGVAIDNNYLRILAETGLLGFASFLAIFITLGIYIFRLMPKIDSPEVRSFILGVVAGIFGLMLNALLIDVFEASKVAFVLWLLSGVTLGILSLHSTQTIHLMQEIRSILTSSYAIIAYLFIITFVLFWPMIGNFFVGDDYTWFRWAADCQLAKSTCSVPLKIAEYFLSSDGFFYRPGTKLYFFLMYQIFWLNPTVYHLVSLGLHFSVAVIFFFLARKILKDSLLATIAAMLFLLLSGYTEIVFWISATGHLFNAFFILLSLVLFIIWDEKKRKIYFIASLMSVALSLLFHELGVVSPLLMLLYKFTQNGTFSSRKLLNPTYFSLFIPVFFYLVLRFLANSHWFGGDYNYNLFKLPFNFVGNSIGYFLLTIFGPLSLPFYSSLREITREHLILSLIPLVLFALLFVFLFRKILPSLQKQERQILIFGGLFFVISLFPFLGLGNIAARYSYLASTGAILLLVLFLKRVYEFFKDDGRDIALTAVITLLSVFSLTQIIQIQQLHSDWYEAGEKVKRFFVSLEERYGDNWSKERVAFHFVNVPISQGKAWVFPVGLPDAIWFLFRNPSLEVYTWRSAQDALNSVRIGPPYERVFRFKGDGSVVEIRKGEKST